MVVRSMTVTAWPSRYELLDGIRGLAALAVVLEHLNVVHSGHFAVMVFFVISGYCITAAADSCRRNDVGIATFMIRRVKRIYPPYLLAIVFYLSTRAIKASMGGINELQRPVLDWVQNLTLTQWLSNLYHPVSVPSDNPHLFVVAFWSLNYEEQFYLVMAVGLALAAAKRMPLIVLVLLLAGVGLIWNWSIPGDWIYGFFIEYWVHFALGACLYFSLCVFKDLRSRWLFLAALLLLGFASTCRLMPWTTRTDTDLRAMVEYAFLSAITFGLMLLRPLSTRITRAAIWRPFAALGTISYSLYLIHQFNLNLVSTVARHALPSGTPPFLLITTMMVLHLVLATGFWYCCERPFLSKKPVVTVNEAIGRVVRPA